MAKATKTTKSAKTTKNVEMTDTTKKEVTVEQASKQVEKRALFYLASKANHIIEIENNGQISYIQPFGKIKVIKDKIKINPGDAKFLTFIKA